MYEGEEVWIWIFVCFLISMLFAVATLIVYTVTPELKNVQGSIFRSCLAAYISWLFCTTFAISLLAPRLDNLILLCFGFVFVLAAGYFGAVYMMWLNVMSFDIGKKFRNLRPCCDININHEREKTKFIRYKIYAWGGSLVPVLIFVFSLLTTELSYPGPKSPDTPFRRVFFLGLPVIGTSLCNACFYISTAFNIRKLKAETANFTNGENKHHKENQQWFSLYLKLFVIMEGPLIFYIPGLYFWNPTIFKFISALEGLQGILIFLIFVWKDDVKRSFRKQFVGRMPRLGSFLRCNSTLGNEELQTYLNDNCETPVRGSND